jgi:UDP-N-acetylglucosamine 2-epimerase (non-hydrolysing)
MARKLKIVSVVGARPNFMKIAPFYRAMADHADRFELHLIHTGQHYDVTMSEIFFRDLNIPPPDADLGIGSGSHAEQVGHTMIALEKTLQKLQPAWVVVVGDVNATCASAITAKKERVKLAHIEAGLRSFDLTMPEEINRIVTDRLADLLFTTDALADANLRAEGTPPERIRCVGNVMIDTLERHKPAAARLDPNVILRMYEIEKRAPERIPPLADRRYAVVTLHRPANVDHRDSLARLTEFIAGELSAALPVVWPLHPRTRKQLDLFGLWPRLKACDNVVATDALGYHEMLRLNLGAALMLTDSGGLQEECCVLGTPCLTLRENTERPITLREHGGMCLLVGNDIARVRSGSQAALTWPHTGMRPPLWDGHAAERIAACFVELTEKG